MAPTGPTSFFLIDHWWISERTQQFHIYKDGVFFPFEHAYFYCEESRHQFHVLRVKRRFGIHSLLRVVICVHSSRWTSAELF